MCRHANWIADHGCISHDLGHRRGDVAFGRAFVRFSAEAADGTELRSLNNRLTLVLKRQAEGWKIVHEHTSAPIDDASCKAMLQLRT